MRLTNPLWRLMVWATVIALVSTALTVQALPASAVGTCNGKTATVDFSNRNGVTYRGSATKDDVIIGSPGADDLSGLGGNDTICGKGGADKISGGDGNDVLIGGSGPDTIHGGNDSDTIKGGDGHDVLRGDSGNDVVLGEKNNDNIRGGHGTDRLEGGEGRDEIYGDDGNDTVAGGGWDDKLFGGNGNDTMTGWTGHDEMHGGDGLDTINGGAGDDIIHGGPRNDTIAGGDGDDEITGSSGSDTITGGNGNDTINGDSDNDTINGGNGSDTVTGGTGNDIIHGNAGNDRMFGGSGDDSLYGGGWLGDRYDGGLGLDTCEDDANQQPSLRRGDNWTACEKDCSTGISAPGGLFLNNTQVTYNCRWVSPNGNFELLSDFQQSSAFSAGLGAGDRSTASHQVLWDLAVELEEGYADYLALGLDPPNVDAASGRIRVHIGGYNLPADGYSREEVIQFDPVSGENWGGHRTDFWSDGFIRHELAHQFQWVHTGSRQARPEIIGGQDAFFESMAQYLTYRVLNDHTSGTTLDRNICRGSGVNPGRVYAEGGRCSDNFNGTGDPWDPAYQGQLFFRWVEIRSGRPPAQLIEQLSSAADRAENHAELTALTRTENYAHDYWEWLLGHADAAISAGARDAFSNVVRTGRSSNALKFQPHFGAHRVRIEHGTNSREIRLDLVSGITDNNTYYEFSVFDCNGVKQTSFFDRLTETGTNYTPPAGCATSYVVMSPIEDGAPSWVNLVIR